MNKLESSGLVTETVSIDKREFFRNSVIQAVKKEERGCGGHALAQAVAKAKVAQVLYKHGRLPPLSYFSCLSDSGSNAYLCDDARILIKGSERECDVIVCGVNDKDEQDAMHAYISGDIWYRVGNGRVVRLRNVLFCPGADLGVTENFLSEPTVLISVKRMATECNVGTRYLAGGDELQHTDKKGKVVGSYKVQHSSLYVQDKGKITEQW